MLRGFGLCLALAAFLAMPVAAQQLKGENSTKEPFDSEMRTYARIDWTDSTNPRYVNLDNDLFLVDTASGLQIWDVYANSFAPPRLSDSLADIMLERLLPSSWARLGHRKKGTVFAGTGSSNALYWWDSEAKSISAALAIEKISSLLAISTEYALLCTREKDGKLVWLNQISGTPSLEWAAPGNPGAQEALRVAGIVGTVSGFTPLRENDISLPIFYDVSRCGWEIKNPPDNIRPFLDKRTRQNTPTIKPYFLRDGSILLSEGHYYVGDRWEYLNPPLLWRQGAKDWIAIEHTANGGKIHREGLEEPVFSYGFQSAVIEFLDTRTMTWARSTQRLPEGNGVNIEPLSTGNALVLMRDLFSSSVGVVGILAPVIPAVTSGHLLLERYRYGEEIIINGGLMLVGGGNEWNPITRNEIIDATKGVSRQIASSPVPLVSPYGLELKDGSILVFGGLPARCGPSFHLSKQCKYLPAQASYRYFPKDNRWEEIPELTIPFTSGFWWQTGNSDLSSQWARNDAKVRRNGDVVWVEDKGSIFDDNTLPQLTYLMRWKPTTQHSLPEPIAPLRKARSYSSVIELVDGRVALMGGFAQLERVALEKDCFNCPDEFISLGPFREARTTEILKESADGSQASWQPGPTTHYAGGSAFKLANGRIFKLSRGSWSDEDGYRAEIADAAFSHWEKLPPIPLKSAVIRNLNIVGNRVVIFFKKKPTLIWDDDIQRWQLFPQWPRGIDNDIDPPISITKIEQSKRVLIRYGKTFDVVPLPVGRP